MKIDFYLDESGSKDSRYFTVGGFYRITNNKGELDKTKLKLKSKIKKIFKKVNDLDLTNSLRKELKWSNTTDAEKEYILKNIPKYDQSFISITFDMNEYYQKTKYKNNNVDILYNFLVYRLVDKKINNLNYKEKIEIKIYADERSLSPKTLMGLEQYLYYHFWKYENIKISLTWCKSDNNYFIQYADFIIGLIRSQIYSKNNIKFKEREYNELYKYLHKNLYCIQECYLNFSTFNYCILN